MRHASISAAIVSLRSDVRFDVSGVVGRAVPRSVRGWKGGSLRAEAGVQMSGQGIVTVMGV